MDRLIQKIQLIDELENETFVNFIKQLAIDDQISLENAKLIIEKYKKERGVHK
ncbi:TPA: SHOCT-like domain-containing protein [Burkholderia orbicola]